MGGLFGSGSNAAQQEVYAGIQVSTSLLGQCIPYVAGRQRLPFNLMWYGNWTVSTSNSGGGKGAGGSGNKQYSYSTAFIAGLCIGPIWQVLRIWHDKALVNLSLENLALSEGGGSFTGSISGTSMVLTGKNGGFASIGARVTGVGVTPGTSIVSGPGGLGTYVITPSQTVAATTLRISQPTWSGYPSGTPAGQQIPYDSIAYVASSAYSLGASAGMPNLNFEVEGVVPGYNDALGVYDADPSAVFQDYLLDPVHGALAGFPGTPLTLGSSDFPMQGTSNSYQAYAMSMGLLTSPYENTQRQATDFISELLQCTNSTCRLSFTVLEVLPYCDQAVSATVAGTAFSYTPNLTPEFIFTDDDYFPEKDEPPLKLTRVPQSDTYNMVNVAYLDRSNYYNEAPANCSDLNDIAKFGPRLATELTWHQITQAAVAKTAGQLWLSMQLYERNSYVGAVRADYALLEPGDFIAHNDANLGLVNQVCQITQIDDDADNKLTLTAREITGVSRSTALYNWAGAQGYFANQAADPGLVAAPAIFAMPPIPGSLSEGITLGIAVCGQTSNAVWLGCDVYVSADGGTTYQLEGTIPEAVLYGTTTGNIGAVADPDTTSTLPIVLANTNLQLPTSATHSDADSALTLCLVDSGTNAEVMSYGSSALVSLGNYDLTYLRRNQYGSTNQPHASGATFVRMDGRLFQLPIDPGYSGKTLFFKFLSFNNWNQNGPQTIAGSTAYSYTVPDALPVGGTATLIPRGSCAISGQTVYKATTGASGWDSDCISASSYGSVSVSAQYATNGLIAAIGLVSSTASILQPASNMDFCLYSNSGSTYIYEGTTLAQTVGTTNKNDLWQITYDGFTVRYYVNGLNVHSTQKQGAQLYIALTEYDSGAVFSNVETTVGALATPAQFVATGTCVVNNTNAMKQGGANAWDSAVYSVIGYQTCHITGKVNSAGASNMIGLATSPVPTPANVAAGIVYFQANYALEANGGGTGNWQAYELGSAVATFSASSASDIVALTYDGSTVTYWINGASVRTVSVSGLTLYGFCPIATPGTSQGINSLRFGPTTNLAVADTAQLGANAASQIISATSTSFSTNLRLASPFADMLTASGIFSGAPVGIDFSATMLVFLHNCTLNSPLQIVITRDGIQIGVALVDLYDVVQNTQSASPPPVLSWYIPSTLIVNDTPSAGAHTYAAHLVAVTCNTGAGIVAAGVSASAMALKVREYKK